jgi:hypothetical protein
MRNNLDFATDKLAVIDFSLNAVFEVRRVEIDE